MSQTPATAPPTVVPDRSADRSAPAPPAPPVARAVRGMSNRLVTLLVGGVLAVGVGLVELRWRLPPYPSDQLHYFDFATTFPHRPEFDDPEFFARFFHLFLRHGLVIPIRLAQEVFGYSQAAYLVVPVLAGVALAVGVYFLGFLLFGRTVGVAAAVLTVGNSIAFPELTQPLPDLLATALLTCALALAVAVRQRRLLVTGGSPWRERVALLAIGGLLGWSYLAREYIVFVWPLVPLLLLRRVPLRRLLWIVLPLAAIGAGETALNAWAFGDPLARFHASSAHGSVPPPTTDFLGHSRRWYLTRILWVFGSAPEGWWLKAALVATVVGGVFSRRLAILLVWAGLFYVPLVTLGGVLDPDHPMLRILKERYWLPLVPAVMLGAVAAVFLLTRTLARLVPLLRARAGLVASVAALAAVVVPVGIAQHARTTDLTDPLNATYAANGGTQLEQFRSWLATGDGAQDHTIWADQRSVRLVRVFVHGTFGGRVWDGRILTWETPEQRPGAPSPARGDLVFFYSPHSTVCGYCRGNAEALVGTRPLAVPESWRLAFATDDGLVEVYEVR